LDLILRAEDSVATPESSVGEWIEFVYV